MPKTRQVQILPPGDSAALRAAYLLSFADTTRDHYRQYIGTRQQFSDGRHYTGYVWECLRQPFRITYERFCHEVVRYMEVLVFADDHSRDRVINAPLWPYPPCSVITLSPALLLELLPALPEDIYVFDTSVSWTLVLTHEHDRKRRLCLGMGFEE